jgi:hypothetical protein
LAYRETEEPSRLPFTRARSLTSPQRRNVGWPARQVPTKLSPFSMTGPTACRQGPMVRIHFPPAASHTKSCAASPQSGCRRRSPARSEDAAVEFAGGGVDDDVLPSGANTRILPLAVMRARATDESRHSTWLRLPLHSPGSGRPSSASRGSRIRHGRRVHSRRRSR